MKFYNIEMLPAEARLFCRYLKKHGYYYEASGAGCLIHIEVKADNAARLNKALDAIYFIEKCNGVRFFEEVR